MPLISPGPCGPAGSLWELGSLPRGPPLLSTLRPGHIEELSLGHSSGTAKCHQLRERIVKGVRERVYELLLLLALSQLSMSHRAISLQVIPANC